MLGYFCMSMHAFYVPFLSKGSVSGSINFANEVTVTLEKNWNSKFQIFWAAFSQVLKHCPVPLFGHNVGVFTGEIKACDS